MVPWLLFLLASYLLYQTFIFIFHFSLLFLYFELIVDCTSYISLINFVFLLLFRKGTSLLFSLLYIFREIYFSLARVICTPVCDLGVNLLQTELTASMNYGSKVSDQKRLRLLYQLEYCSQWGLGSCHSISRVRIPWSFHYNWALLCTASWGHLTTLHALRFVLPHLPSPQWCSG
jgi:hypothetical protein